MVASSESAIAKPKVYESKRIQLTSPILHIGSQVSRLNPFEYVQTSQRVYLPNSEVLARALHQRGRLKDYITAIENRQDIAQLLEDVFGNNWRNATNAEGDRLFPELSSSQKWTEQRVTDLRPMIRNGMGQLYIPGSSIKGAIRTAIAYHLLKHENEYGVPSLIRVSEIELKLREKLAQGQLANKYQQKFLDDQLFMNSLFSDFDLIYQSKKLKSKQGPNTDFMRAVKVTDSQPLLEEKVVNKQGQTCSLNLPIVAEVIVSSRFPDGRAKYRASIYAEMVRNVRTEFTISLDEEMLSWFSHREKMRLPFKTVDEIINICKEFVQEQWDYEHDYWQEVHNSKDNSVRKLDFTHIRELYEFEKCPFSLRLGWGSGMIGTTIGLCLDDKLRAEVRDTAGIAAPGFEAPKSRRTVVGANGQSKYVPGWIKFKVL